MKTRWCFADPYSEQQVGTAVKHILVPACLCTEYKIGKARLMHASNLLTHHGALLQVVDDWSRRSFRLLAVAAGVVHDVNGLDLGSMSLQQLEGCCNLHLLGLTVLSNHLRPESKATISELQERCVSMAAQWREYVHCNVCNFWMSLKFCAMLLTCVLVRQARRGALPTMVCNLMAPLHWVFPFLLSFPFLNKQ